MTDAVAWALGGLACWRLTHLLWAEDGPGQVIARWRDRLPRSPQDGLPWLVGCFYCLSLWVALPLTGLVLLATGAHGPPSWRGLATGLIGWLGLSGGCITLERWLDRAAAPPVTSHPATVDTDTATTIATATTAHTAHTAHTAPPHPPQEPSP